MAYLREHQCDQIQGFFVSQPLSAPELEQLLLTDVALTKAGGDTTVSGVRSGTSTENDFGVRDAPIRRSWSPIEYVEGQEASTVDPG